ncbi:MAG: dihydrofolate reductase [Bacteroidales bacterium]|nr:dihydrofolate reductase [Bacteroidales bacterium]MDT8431819.1 dihydrofolate reductase [Bacteroidales bacterium]
MKNTTAIRKNISIIVAVAANNAIGKDNQLLWHLTDDLKRFRRLTSGHTVVMGRNTYLSLPKGALPNRRNIVITDRPGEQFEGCEMAYSIDQALDLAGNEEECFIMGGGMVYQQLFPVAGKLYLTTVDHSFDADTFFPEIDFAGWNLVESEFVNSGGKNDYPHTFTLYERKA